jgi:multidrug resistance efflux pump
MATAFSRTLRSLAVDASSRTLWGVLLMTLLLCGWVAWGLLAGVAVYAVTQTARLEVHRAIHPVAAPVAGQVVTTRLVVGQEVQAGDVLVDLDATAQRLQLEGERTRLHALAPQLDALRTTTAAEEQVLREARQTARAALDEGRARHGEGKVAAQAADEEAELFTRLQARGLPAQVDLMRAKAEAQRRRAAVDTHRLAVTRLESDHRTQEGDRKARLEGLKRDITRLTGEMATAAATVERLEHEIERRHIRAPTSGQLGEVAVLQIGAVVREGDVLGAVLPHGGLRVVASFPPPVALGRLHPGQPAELRLEGFPWTQYGSIAATVTSVAHEVRDGQVRVELALAPDVAFPIPLQHGMPGTVEVEVERVAPATLVLRSIGKRLGLAGTARERGEVDGMAR